MAQGAQSEGDAEVNQLVTNTSRVPAIIAASGEKTGYRFLEFFTANVRNPHTRRAYARTTHEFVDRREHSRRSLK